MVDVEKCFADNNDDRRLSDLQLSARSNTKKATSRVSTENSFTNFTRLQSCWYLGNNDSRIYRSSKSR